MKTRDIHLRGSPWLLAYLSLGVVFGDIGTSPLYALRETFFGHYPVEISFENVVGGLSLFFWSLFVVITVKYIWLITQADNEGEGGIFSLLGLIKQSQDKIPKRTYFFITTLILAGAALLYGDGIITPAISVLSAVEGLRVITPAFDRLVIPITLLILFGLFAIQKRGTNKIGFLFSPVMVLWFGLLVIFAIPHIARHPEIVWAVNPFYGFKFLWYQGFKSFWILGAVVLCVTGGEALYADLGHFGRKAIAKSWIFFVYPALLINYLGQGARLLDPVPIVSGHLFYSIVPAWALIPMVILSTAATVIASQALISGCYSITYQAIALGVFPRLRIIHTNPDIRGQIFMPLINWMLFTGCVLLVLGFRNSSGLAAAYGIAVTGTMAVTTAAFYVVARHLWKWNFVFAALLCGSLVMVDLTFFFSNALKFFHGGFVPIVIGLFLFGVMWIWRWGRLLMANAYTRYSSDHNMEWLVQLKERLSLNNGILKDDRIRRLVESDRVVIFMTSRPITDLSDNMPACLRIYLKRNGVLPKYIVIMTIIQEKIPFIAEGLRYRMINFGHDIHSVQARFGFMEQPDVKKVIRELSARKVIASGLHRCTIEISEDEIVPSKSAALGIRILSNIFEIILKKSTPASNYFALTDVAGLAKTVVPISINREGARIEIPEFAFDLREEELAIDPDTLKPSETKFAEINNDSQ